MVLAVGRLELQVTVGMRDEFAPSAQPAQPSTLERAYERAQLDRAVEADRNHWTTLSSLTGPRRP